MTGEPHSTKKLFRIVTSDTGPDSYQLRASSEISIALIGVLKKIFFSITTFRRVVTNIPRVGILEK